MNREFGKFGGVEGYRGFLIEQEAEMLPRANQYEPGEQFYGNRRASVADVARGFVEKKPGSTELRVLELGAGVGNATLKLRGYFQDHNSDLFFTATSLNRLPEHDELERLGVQVRTGVIAERMPVDWSGGVDLVMTECMIGWTKYDLAIPEIRRVLAEGGVWVGVESRKVHYPYSGFDLVTTIRMSAEAFGFRKQELGIDEFWFTRKHDAVPFAYEKHGVG